MAAPPPPSLKLTVEKGPKEGEWVEAKNNKSSIRIGRVVRGNSLAIKEDGISSKHLLIQLDQLGGRAWILQDLNSSNGTILNASPLPPNAPVHLADGDTIKIGAYTVIKVHIGAAHHPQQAGGASDDGDDERVLRQPIPRNNTRQARGGRNTKAVADGGGGGGRITRSRVDDRGNAGSGDAGVSSRVVESVETRGGRLGGRTTRSRARVNGGASTEVLEAPAAVERRGGRKTRGRGGDGDSVADGAGAELVLEAPKQRKGRPPRKPGASKTALEVEKVEEVEEERVSTASGADGIEQMVSNLGSKGEGGCEETGELAPKEMVAAASGCKGNLDVVPNLDMPLGEWLDYVERQLLKQIDEETEPIIEGMKLKAKRVAEYVASSREEEHQSEK